MSERHAILGAGGVGGLLGAVLGAGGEQVTLVVRAGTAQAYPPEITLRRPDGSVVTGPVRTVGSLAPGDAVDVLWVTTKALTLEDALRSVAGVRARSVVPLLNGLDHLAVLAKAFGADAVVPATVAVEAERLAPGLIRQGSPFATVRFAERGRERLAETVAALKRFGVASEFVADETTLMWSKLVFLAPFALATAGSGLTLGPLRGDPEWLGLMTSAVEEIAATGRAEGAALDSAYAAGLLKAAPPGLSSSMARDVAAGNEPELDAIAGAVVRAADRHGIPVPALRELMRRVRERIALGAVH